MEKYLVYYFDLDDQSELPWYEDAVVYRVNNFSELKTKIKEYIKKNEEPLDEKGYEESYKLNWQIFKVKDIPGDNESNNKIKSCFYVTLGTKDFGNFFERIFDNSELVKNFPIKGKPFSNMSEEELQELLTKVSNELERRDKEKRNAAKEKLESLLVEVNKLTETFNFTLIGNDEEDCCRYFSHVEVWD